MTTPKTRVGPSRVVAAEFLHKIARDVGKPIANPEQRAEDLRLIADCILGDVRWSKGGAYSFHHRIQINRAAFNVEHRTAGVSVGCALDSEAKRLVDLFGRAHEPNAEQKIRDHITVARKLQRKLGWPTAHQLEK